MSHLPEVPVAVLGDMFSPFEIEVVKGVHGIALVRAGDSKVYRLAPTGDGWVRGTHLSFACQFFGVDPFALFTTFTG